MTITQVQALRAARNAGIVVPKRGHQGRPVKYLQGLAPTPHGGVIYSLATAAAAAAGRPALTAAAICLRLQRRRVQVRPGQEVAQVLPDAHPALRRRPHRPRRVHALLLRPGDLRPRRRPLRRSCSPTPRTTSWLTWSKYRKAIVRRPQATQSRRQRTAAGPAATSARSSSPPCYLTILQLDNGSLPIYQR